MSLTTGIMTHPLKVRFFVQRAFIEFIQGCPCLASQLAMCQLRDSGSSRCNVSSY